MFTFKKQPQSIWGVMADGFRLYRASISKVWYWQIIFVLPVLLLTAVDTWVNPNAEAPFSTAYIAFLITASLLVLLIALVGHCFTYSRMHAVGIQGDTSIKASMRLAFRKVLLVFATALTFIVLLFVVVAPLFMLFQMTSSILVAMAGLYIMYTFVFCVALFAVLFPFFILFENNGILEALKNSAIHMWGNFGRALIMLIVLSLIGLGVIFAFLLPLQLLTIFGDSPVVLIVGITGVFLAYTAIYTLVVPVFHAVLLALYHETKVKKAAETEAPSSLAD